MATEVYGYSDDLIEFEGDVRGEVGGTDEDPGKLLIFSDGTLLSVKYGKPGLGGVWGIQLVRRGELFERIDQCTDEDAGRYSDTALFKGGLTGAWAAGEWERVG